ncbi:MAG TPA: DUF2231 domain-containing protein [Bacteroidia bacterium]|jgi:uncharacterized membrane protein
MYSKIKIAGHPLHAMLVPFPVAFYTATMVCFMTYACTSDPFWYRVAVNANIAGVATGALAALPGFIDWLNIPKIKKARKVGIAHMLCNVIALLLFGLNAYLHCNHTGGAESGATTAIILSTSGFVLTLVAGFLGWSLVQKHHIGVSLTEEQQRIDPVDGVR